MSALNTIKLTNRLVSESMKFIKGIDPKNISNMSAFSNVMLDKDIQAQLELELAQSYKLFKNKVRRYVGTLTVSNIEELFSEYVNGLDINNKLVAHHVQLMVSNKNSKSKWFNTAMTELISAQLTTSRYVEMNHIALLVGQSLCNKEHNEEVSIKLSLGSNIIQFLYSLGLVQKEYRRNKEGHNIVSISTKFRTDELVQAGKSIRANSPMLCKPLTHSVLDGEGGKLLQRVVMLNGAKLNHGFKVYQAINYLNTQPLQLRVDNSLIEEWFKTDRFYADDLSELKGEKLKVINDLELFSNRNFYISYAADERGRLNSQSNYINTQGDSYQKSMLIGSKEILTQDGIDALKITVVNEIHSDKISREEAITWFDMNQENISNMLSTPMSKVMYADYLKAIKGEAVGSICHQDMTNSGLAIYSLLGRDEKGASLTNLLFTGKLADAYKALADALNKVLGITNLNRSTVKKAFMVFLYGSGKALLTSTDIDDERYSSLLDAVIKGLGKDIEVADLWTKFESAMESIAPAAISLMKLIYKFKREDSHYSWVMPDGFVVDIKVKSKTPTDYKGFSVTLDGKTHSHTISVIEYLKDSKYDKSLAPHIIHSIDAYILRCITRKCEELNVPLYVIHDSFGTTPNYYYELNAICREVLAEVLEEDLLEDILSQLDATKLEVAINRGMLPKGQLTTSNLLSAINCVR